MEASGIDFRYAPASVWTSIALVDDPYKTLVREDGALLYGFYGPSMTNFSFDRVYEFGLRAARGPIHVAQTTESARFPCVVTRLEYARATLTLRAFAHRDGERRSDIVLWEIQLRDGVAGFLTGLTVDVYDRHRHILARSEAPARVLFAAEQLPAVPEGFTEGDDVPLVEDERIPAPGPVAFVAAPDPLIATHPAGFRPHGAFGTVPAVLRPGETLRGAIIIPQNEQEVTGLDEAWAEAAYTAARADWERSVLLELPIRLPDPAVNEMLVACARNILQARERRGSLPVFQVGATIYRGLWVVDGHFILEAAQYLGYHDEAYRGLDALLERAAPDGSITIFPFHTKETGIALATLVRQCELMGDLDRLRALWPLVQRAVGFIERLREEAYALPEDSPCYRLLPMSFGDGGLGGKRGEYTTVFWILAGLRSVSQAARRLGMASEAERIGATYESLLADFRRAARRDMRRLPDGTPYLPICMPGSGEHVWMPNYPDPAPDYQRLTPASATWAFCHAIYPGEVFGPDDPLVQNLLQLFEQLDDEEGLPDGTGWLPYNALWSYHGAFAAQVWLYAGRGDKAADYLYALANHAAPTRVWREEQSLTASQEGQHWGEMPHNWASAEFVRLARHLLIFERGDGLDLLAGVAAAWRRPGDVIAVEGSPTRFGPVSLRLETGAREAFRLVVMLEPAGAARPETIRALLPAHTLRINGAPSAPDERGWVRLPAANTLVVEGIWESPPGGQLA